MVSIFNMEMPADKYGIKCPYLMQPSRIVVHNTANKGTARGEIEYMQSNNSYVSFHYAVDENEAVQGAPLNRNTWHASDGTHGKGNREGIAIEICRSYCPVVDAQGNATGDEKLWQNEYKGKFEKAQENAAELVAYLLHTYGWGCDLSRVTKHQDYCDKYCPHRTMSEYGWEYFLNLVKEKYESLYSEDIPMTAAEKQAFEALKEEVRALNKKLKKETRRYNTAEECPSYGRATVQKLIDTGILKGKSKNALDLSEDAIRILVYLDRAGAFKD